MKGMVIVEYYSKIREPKKTGWFPRKPNDIDTIIRRLRRLDIPVVKYAIDIADYYEYVKKAGYKEHYPENYNDSSFSEKTMEHFLAAKLLNLKKEDVFIDVASSYSPTAKIFSRLYGVFSYQQDMLFPEGINGNIIGGDAANMPVPDGFASKMGLHCSFEHFEGDADSRFAQEIERVLAPAGKVCILPLYLEEEYGYYTDPEVAVRENVLFGESGTIYCVEGFGQRHARFYSPDILYDRVIKKFKTCQVTVVSFENWNKIDGVYCRFALLVEKLGRETGNF